MRIAVIGTGNIGAALGRKWSALGHIVQFGVRDTDSPSVVALKLEKFKITDIQEAVNASDVIVLAIPFQAVEEVLKNTLGLTMKILVDTTNAVSTPLPYGYESAAEAIAYWSKSSKVVKAFNSTGVANLVEPLYGDHKIETYICGNDAVANALVAKLAEDIGFSVVEVGKLDQSCLVENLAKLWITLAYKQGLGPDFAFKLIKR